MQRLLVPFAVVLGCAVLLGIAATGRASAIQSPGLADGVAAAPTGVEAQPSVTPTPIPPTAGTGYDEEPAETYVRGMLAIGLVLGVAVGGTLMAAAYRSRRL